MTLEAARSGAVASPEELAAAVTLPDFRALAQRSVEAGAWDYIDGGSWDEMSLAENDAAWRRYRFRPRVLVDVSKVDPSTTMFGTPIAMPAGVTASW